MAKNGSLELFKWIRHKASPWTAETATALYVNKQIKPGYGEPEISAWFAFFDYTTKLACTAAQYGHLDILKWLVIEQGAELVPKICKKAASGGYVNIVRWARQEGCDWPPDTTTHEKIIKSWDKYYGCPFKRKGSIRLDHIEFFELAENEGCKWNGTTV